MAHAEITTGITLRMRGQNTVLQATRDIQNEIKNLERRYEALSRTGKLSHEQLQAAAIKMRTRQAALLKDMANLENSVGQTAVAKHARNMEARRTLGIRAEVDIQREIKRTELAYQTLAQSGVLSAQAMTRAQDAHLKKIRELKNEMGQLTAEQKKAAEVAARNARGERYAGYGMTAAVGAGAGYMAMKAMVNKYATLEQAQTDLRVSMTDRDGKVSGDYGKTLSVATELGNKLPGTTKDFILEAQALKQMGISDAMVSGGGLRAAGMLRVGMNLRSEGEAGTLVGKTVHAFDLKDKDLPVATDQIYRLSKAFGQKGGHILESNTYMSGALNQLGWTGFENMKRVQAMQGMMAMKGIEASVFGTNFADMLTDAAQIKSRLHGKGAEVKEVNHTLASKGIKLEFFDKKGNFVDPDGFLKQLEKLKVLTPEQLVPVLHKLFGTQGARVGTHLVRGGRAAVNEAQDKVDNQLDVNKAVAELTNTFSGKSEALGGSVENLAAQMAEPIGNALKPSLEKLNDWAGKLTDTFKENPMAGAAAAIGTASAAAAAAMGLFGLAIRSGIGIPVRVVGSGAPGLPGTAPTPPVGPPPGTPVSKLGLLGTASAAVAPLAVMYGVTEWAGDTSNDKGRVDVLQGVSGLLAGLLATIGLDKEKEFERRRAELRAELEVTVTDDRAVVTKTKLTPTNMNASMNTGNLNTGAP